MSLTPNTVQSEHVRDDAGHSSSTITDRYIDVELRERHHSARMKSISDED